MQLSRMIRVGLISLLSITCLHASIGEYLHKVSCGILRFGSGKNFAVPLQQLLNSMQRDITVRVTSYKQLRLAAGLAYCMDADEVNAKIGDYGWTPLHWSVYWNLPEWVDALIDVHATIDAEDVNGVTPLSIAVGLKREEIEKKLLAAGADEGKVVTHSRLILPPMDAELERRIQLSQILHTIPNEDEEGEI